VTAACKADPYGPAQATRFSVREATRLLDRGHAAETRLAALEESPACELSQFFTVTDETINGEVGPNLIYDGPSIWQSVPVASEPALYTLWLDSTPFPTPTGVTAEYAYYTGPEDDMHVVRIDWDRAPYGRDEWEVDEYYHYYWLYRAESPDGPWGFVQLARDFYDSDESYTYDAVSEPGRTYYYCMARIDEGVSAAFSPNVSPPSEVAAVYIP